MEETWRLWATIEAWWPAVEVLITHRVTNARRGREHRHQTNQTDRPRIQKSGHYQARILLTSAAPTRGVNPLTRHGTTVNCEWPSTWCPRRSGVGLITLKEPMWILAVGVNNTDFGIPVGPALVHQVPAIR
jgi:hypothetical protein